MHDIEFIVEFVFISEVPYFPRDIFQLQSQSNFKKNTVLTVQKRDINFLKS